MMLSIVCLTSVAYIESKSRTERPRKTKIGTEVAHVTRDSNTTFKVRLSKVNLQGTGAYCGGLPHSLLSRVSMRYTESGKWNGISISPSVRLLVWAIILVFMLDALALSVIAMTTWLGGWLGGCLSQPVLYQND